MKILHIGKYFAPFNGGLENYQRDAMVALAARGIQCAGLVHRHELSLATHTSSIEAHGLQLPIVKTATWAKLLFTPISPGFFFHLLRLIKSFKPNVLHLHMPNPSAFWALFMPSARRLPWVVHWHSDVITEQQDWKMKFFYQIYRHFERAVLKRAAAIIATSPPYLESSLPLQAFRDKCFVVPLGVDSSRISVENDGGNHEQRHSQPEVTPTDSEPAPLQVLAIGRLTYYKGFQYLIQATALTNHVHINVVGTGEQESYLKELSASLKVQKRVTFRGNLDQAQLAELMSQCDCLCLPSIERTEAFGMVLLEAQFFAKATIVTDVPGSGMGWVVDHGISGIIVPVADAQALASTLTQMDKNRSEMFHMGQMGKKKFEQEFEIDHAIQGLMSVYQQVIRPVN